MSRLRSRCRPLHFFDFKSDRSGAGKLGGFRMVRISGFGELVSDSQSDGMRYAFDPSSGGKIFCRLCNSLSWSIGTISSSCTMIQMMEELFNRLHNIVMEMEGSVVVLFTL
ncbi:hypothetical protein DY000_02032096 [Brassica cretica]|uniref:Uncharacterized protein n=1 Tax=Brassica cretica TaxID=69181 RepID=A0ABQ7DDP1_BRACR|nr:hypothetical protein DY000_02032096 [Brassica cretica]